MTWPQALVAIAGSVVAGLAILREWPAMRGPVPRIRRQLDLLDALPDDSAVRTILREAIDQDVHEMLTAQRELRRDPGGMALGAVILVGGVWAVVEAASGGAAWQWAVGAVFVLLGTVGFASDATAARRDERGRRLTARSGRETSSEN